MFRFFRDVYYDVRKIEPKKKPKEEKIFFSKIAKIIITIVGVLYLGVAILGIISCFHLAQYVYIIKYILLLILDITTIIFIFQKNKKSEMIAFGCIISFMVINYLSALI